MPEYLAPGVYVEETSFRAKSIEGVATSTAGFVGQARFGPSFDWVQTEDYTVDPAGADHFYEQVRRYWPALPDGVLQPAYAQAQMAVEQVQ